MTKRKWKPAPEGTMITVTRDAWAEHETYPGRVADVAHDRIVVIIAEMVRVEFLLSGTVARRYRERFFIRSVRASEVKRIVESVGP